MTGSYYQRIAAFLSCYTELQREALEKFDVVIPDRYFLEV